MKSLKRRFNFLFGSLLLIQFIFDSWSNILFVFNNLTLKIFFNSFLFCFLPYYFLVRIFLCYRFNLWLEFFFCFTLKFHLNFCFNFIFDFHLDLIFCFEVLTFSLDFVLSFVKIPKDIFFLPKILM